MSSVKSERSSLFVRNLTFRQLLTFRRFLAASVVLAGLVVAVVMSQGVASDGTADDLPAPQTTILPVPVEVLQQVTQFDQLRSYTGVLAARRSTDLGFERSARLVELKVDEGDTVALNQELGRLDIRRLKAREQNLTAQRNAAAAILAELRAGPRKETIAAARADVAALTATALLAERTFQRNARLRRSNAVAQQVLDDSEFAARTAVARRDSAQKRLDELEAGTRKEQVDAQEARVAQLDALLADLKVDQQDSVLLAPFAGRVSARFVDEGAVVTPGQPVFRIVETTVLEARIGLPLDVAGRMQRGDSILIDVGESSVRGTFVRSLPEVNLQTRTQEVVLEIEGNQQLAPGQVVRFEATQSVEATGFWLPVTALSPGQRGLWSVFALESADENFVVSRRPVEMLHTDGDRVLVRGTIKAGDRVVSDGIHRVVPGQTVRIDE